MANRNYVSKNEMISADLKNEKCDATADDMKYKCPQPKLPIIVFESTLE
ncbi:MAG: hypothetical protein ABUT20_09070 [Bacteroidota bacterium]